MNLTPLKLLPLRCVAIKWGHLTHANALQLKALVNLKEIDFSYSQNLDCLALGQLSELTKLQSIKVASTEISDAVVQQWKNLPHLKLLNLSYCKTIYNLHDICLTAFSRLEDLSLLGCTRIAPRSFGPLSNLARLSSFKPWLNKCFR